MFAHLPNGTAARGKRFVTTALIAAFILSTLVTALFLGREGLGAMLIVITPSVLAAAGFAILFWSKLMRRQETKRRGAVAGILTGLCALPFAISPFVLFQSLTEANASSANLLTNALGMILLGILFTFIFGGFLAPIMGGIVGAIIAKNDVSEENVKNVFD